VKVPNGAANSKAPVSLQRPVLARGSKHVPSNKEFGRGEVSGDDTVAAAMTDRLVHHAGVIALKGDSYRLKNHDLGRIQPRARTSDQPQRGPLSTVAAAE
jgi:hypothetical protein